MDTEVVALLSAAVGAMGAIAASYVRMTAQIEAAVEARVGTRLAAVESVARGAEGAAKMLIDSRIVVLGTPGDSRDATTAYLRLSGWRGVDALAFAEDSTTLAAIRGADAIVLDRVDAPTARAVAAFLGLPGLAADPLTAAYMPAIVWFTGTERVDPSPFGDGVVTANSRPQTRVHLASGVTARRWAQRARA